MENSKTKLQKQLFQLKILASIMFVNTTVALIVFLGFKNKPVAMVLLVVTFLLLFVQTFLQFRIMKSRNKNS